MIMSLFPYVAYNFLRLFNTKCYPTLPSPHLILRSLCLTPLYDQNLYNSRIKYDADLRDRDGKIMTNITKPSQLNHKRKKNITILDFPILIARLLYSSINSTNKQKAKLESFT